MRARAVTRRTGIPHGTSQSSETLMGSGALPVEARPPTDGPAPRARGRRDLAICALLGLLAFVCYNANLRAITAADTYAARYLPFSIWRDHTLVLDPVVTEVAQ